jgi:hypothetical protein
MMTIPVQQWSFLMIANIFALEKTYIRKKDRPPCANPAPVGGGGAYDASGLRVKILFFGYR